MRCALRVATLAVLCAQHASPAAGILVEVSDIEVSNGLVYGHAVVVPVGETVSIGVRISNPTGQAWHGIGLSYYGYDELLLAFVSGDAVHEALYEVCLPPTLCLNGANNLVGGPLIETSVFPTVPLAGTPRVRGFVFVSDYRPKSGTGDLDPGLDGVVGAGDAQIRVTFEALADGLTDVEIGTGDDRGGILLQYAGVASGAENANVRLAVPETSFAGGLFVGLVAIAISTRRMPRKRLAFRAEATGRCTIAIPDTRGRPTRSEVGLRAGAAG